VLPTIVAISTFSAVRVISLLTMWAQLCIRRRSERLWYNHLVSVVRSLPDRMVVWELRASGITMTIAVDNVPSDSTEG
jgi:hypothetical protein